MNKLHNSLYSKFDSKEVVCNFCLTPTCQFAKMCKNQSYGLFTTGYIACHLLFAESFFFLKVNRCIRVESL